MEITEVRIFLKDSADKKLKAYATITLDDVFVVRNIKVIEGTNGVFIAMPSRKLKTPCPKCGSRNEARSKYCNQCASSLPLISQPITGESQAQDMQSDHKDIAHPITQEFREYLQKKVLIAYESAKNKDKTEIKV